VYNTFVTAFFVGYYAIWEQDISLNDEKKNQLIELLFPFIYRHTVKEELFTKKKFFVCFAVSLL
jgi:F0F1-type ATP synthase membrane subunit a